MSANDQVIRTVVVDDDPLVTASLATILNVEDDICVVARGVNGDEAVELFERETPDVLLMDIQMPGTDGLAAAERILAAHPQARIVFLTTFSDDEYIVRALRLGARGYLIKQEVSMIAPALRSVLAGQNVLGGEVVGRLDVLMATKGSSGTSAKAAGGADAADVATRGCQEGVKPTVAGTALDLSMLSEREQEILALVAEGLDNREIAATLYLSEGTVRNHISAMLQKLGLKNRTQLAIGFYRG